MKKRDSQPFAVALRKLRRATVAVAVVTFACTASEHVADYGIEPVAKARVNGVEADGEWQAFMFEGANRIPSGRYEDDDIRVDWTVFSFGVTLTIENRSRSPLDVLWSESRIEGDFQAPLILTDPGSPEERKIPQQPTTVGAGEVSTYSAIAGPPGEWQPFTDDPERGFWQRERSLFDVELDNAPEEERRLAAQRAVGREIDLVIVFEIEGERRRLVLPARVIEAKVRAAYY